MINLHLQAVTNLYAIGACIKDNLLLLEDNNNWRKPSAKEQAAIEDEAARLETQQLINTIKAEAGNRILAQYPLWKQQNISRDLALNPTEKNKKAVKACADYIANIQNRSNHLEEQAMDMDANQLMNFNPSEDTL